MPSAWGPGERPGAGSGYVTKRVNLLGAGHASQAVEQSALGWAVTLPPWVATAYVRSKEDLHEPVSLLSGLCSAFRAIIILQNKLQ